MDTRSSESTEQCHGSEVPPTHRAESDRDREMVSICDGPADAGLLAAALTISREIRLECLLVRIVEFAVEHTGAEVGYLVLRQNDEWLLRAETGSGRETALMATPLSGAGRIATSLVDRVAATGDSILLGDIRERAECSGEARMSTNRQRSILCVPLGVPGEVRGVLCLEKSTPSGAFAADRLATLKLLSEQMAVSLDHALMYRALEDLLAEQKSATVAAENAAVAAGRTKNEFLAHMSHELRTPLSSILGFSRMMVRDGITAPDWREKLTIINRSGEHLLALLDDVLEMSKIDAGRTTLTEKDLDLVDLLESLESMFTLKAATKGLHLRVKRSTNVPSRIRTDERKLRQVLVNLLGNAIKFTESGSVIMRVGYLSDKERLTVDVADTGPGIARDELALLFTPFEQTEAGRRSREGTGLGLAISQNFVRLMGGEITVATQPGEGSEFSFDIHAPRAAASRSKSRPARGRVLGLAPGQRVPRVLVAEDINDSSILLTDLLARVGINARVAFDGEQALEIWREWAPDLIWMDMNMPKLSGEEATRRIRDADGGQNTIIIALTAHAFDDSRQRVLDCGCDDMVRKPYRESKIFRKMGEYLGLRYVYKHRRRATTETPHPTANAVDLSGISQAALVELRRAILAGAVDDVERCIAAMKAEHPRAAGALAAMAAEFAYEEILRIVDVYRGGRRD